MYLQIPVKQCLGIFKDVWKTPWDLLYMGTVKLLGVDLLFSKCSLENLFNDFDFRDLQGQPLGVNYFPIAACIETVVLAL